MFPLRATSFRLPRLGVGWLLLLGCRRANLRSSLAVMLLCVCVCVSLSVLHVGSLRAFSSLLRLDALDAGRGRRVTRVSRGQRGAGHGLLGDGDFALGGGVFDWEAKHLASNEVGYVDVLRCWRRHVVGSSVCSGGCGIAVNDSRME